MKIYYHLDPLIFCGQGGVHNSMAPLCQKIIPIDAFFTCGSKSIENNVIASHSSLSAAPGCGTASSTVISAIETTMQLPRSVTLNYTFCFEYIQNWHSNPNEVTQQIAVAILKYISLAMANMKKQFTNVAMNKDVAHNELNPAVDFKYEFLCICGTSDITKAVADT